jgi:hypothetical protein
MRQDELAELQRWYDARCDGEWEHAFGVRIETLDNPGWSVEVDLAGTPLAGRAFPSVRDMAPAREWLSCEVSGDTFRGAGGPPMLGRILRVFLDWAYETQPGSGPASV